MKYPCLPGLTPDGTVYQNSAMGTVEAMLPPGPWATAHAPALLETPDGSLLCAWFAGSFEGSGDVSIVCARLPKGAARWEAPVQVSHDEKRSEQNPSLFLAPDGAVWAVYTAQLDRVPGKDNMQFTSVIRRQKSTDGGRTWGEPDVLFAREGSFCRQPIQVLASGRWIFANWLCSDSASGLAGVSDLRRSGLYLAHCRDAGQQRPCTCQCGGACAGTSRGVHAEPCGRFHLSQ